MDVNEAIETRRAYRALAPIEITPEIIQELAKAAQLAPSCFNMQPWRYVFVHDPNKLEEMHSAYSQGNEWAWNASLVIVVFSELEADCVIREREYYLFDTGLATGQMILRATELDLVAHPIAGFSPRKVKDLLDIPEDKMVITLLIVGKRSLTRPDDMSPDDFDDDNIRPERKPMEEWTYINRYNSQD